ncbi:hypothetical protein BDZ91DRAFT_499222 [Kalaharituber pfeilii]|nr:hypothetical protein BDZ91DRAFT_499222 [Kalaharituber pfeilii]
MGSWATGVREIYHAILPFPKHLPLRLVGIAHGTFVQANSSFYLRSSFLFSLKYIRVDFSDHTAGVPSALLFFFSAFLLIWGPFASVYIHTWEILCVLVLWFLVWCFSGLLAGCNFSFQSWWWWSWMGN